ncbi:MAG: competence protein CoiA family protein [Pseudohongiellaceae bacterium]
MKFALVDGQKSQPVPKTHGLCPHCNAEVVSKCGRVKVWHWAHKSRDVCDPWWENETEWHRSWKDQFPDEWQEISHTDPATGERHVADVKTPHGLVVEFQHSPMAMEELEAREAFYGDMIWIVDGLRNDLDLSHFKMGLGRNPIQTDPLAYKFEFWGRGRIMHNWSQARSRVFLDFGDSSTNARPVVWQLVLFDAEKNHGAVGPYPKHSLVKAITNGEEIGVTFLPEEKEQEKDISSGKIS